MNHVRLSAQRLMAHRGWPDAYPENSFAGVRAALEAGAVHVEFDVQLTADGTPVVIHDPTLHRTAAVDLAIADAAVEAVEDPESGQVVRLAGSGIRLPSLAGMLAYVAGFPDVCAFVDVKEGALMRFGADGVARRVLAAIPEGTRHAIVSGDRAILEFARGFGAERIGWVVPGLGADAHAVARELAPAFLFCSAGQIDPAARAPWAGAWEGAWRWVVYDVNEPEAARSLLAAGVDIVETDRFGDMLER